MADKESFESFLHAHSAQLNTTGIPQRYWKHLHTKLRDEVYDAGNYFSMYQDEDNSSWHVQVSSEEGLMMENDDGIFLVDHAWTYQPKYARKQLEVTMNLAERMCSLMGCLDGYDIEEISQQGFERSKLIDLVLEKMWKYNWTYESAVVVSRGDEIVDIKEDANSKETVWFVMDEFGSRFYHSDDCNLEFKVFYYFPRKVTYSVVYPVKDIEYGEEATRNYLPGVVGELERKARLYPWFPEEFNEANVEDNWMQDRKVAKPLIRCDETLPIPIEHDASPRRNTFKVYSNSMETDYLTLPNFTIVDNEDEADLLWLLTHFKDFKSLSETPEKLVNQFPLEYNLTCKDMLAETAQRWVTLNGEEPSPEVIDNRGPLWLPTTFNLQSEVPQFIKHFKEREKRGQENTWICKPWNLGRGLGHLISSNINEIIRHAETYPRIASKYLEDPVLFRRDDGVGLVKFDYRYMALLKSIKPLEVYVHKVFFPRVANKPFSVDDLYDYEKHFTVMNYKPVKRRLLLGKDFAEMFDEQYPDVTWASIEKQTCQVIKELFQSTALSPPPSGLCHNPQSRALYGIDFMVKWADVDHTKMQVMICEVNFSSDNTTLCTKYEHVVNDIFETLFLDREGERVIKL